MNKRLLSIGLIGLLGVSCATHNPVNRRYTKNCFQTCLREADRLNAEGTKVYGFILYPIDEKIWHCVLDMGDDEPLYDPNNNLIQNPELTMQQDIKSKQLPYVPKGHKMRRYVEGWVGDAIRGGNAVERRYER